MDTPSTTSLTADEDYDSDYGSHHDVSRTVSDRSEQDSEEGERARFARKLGYSEGQVQLALSKLGPCPSQNELLAELIQLDSQAGASSTAQEPPQQPPTLQLRHIVIDGSNVAMAHGQNKFFSCRGIQIVVDWFRQRGHTEVTVFVPSYRKGQGEEVKDPHILTDLESARHLVFTPSRQLANRRHITCYDDRYILKLALETDGVIVSNDNYRDLQLESAEYRRLAEERILMYSFVEDRFMPPDDPLGRNGPTLAQFLSRSPLPSAPPCPYGRKCTYGAKCKYFHPTVKQSVSDNLRKQAAVQTQSLPLSAAIAGRPLLQRVKSAGEVQNGHRRLRREYSIVDEPPSTSSYLPPFPGQPHLSQVWSPIQQRGELEDPVYYHLAAIFPSYQVRHVMELYREERDPGVLCRHIVRLFS